MCYFQRHRSLSTSLLAGDVKSVKFLNVGENKRISAKSEWRRECCVLVFNVLGRKLKLFVSNSLWKYLSF